MRWEAEALESLDRIPPFVRGMVKRRMESYAGDNGITTISQELLQDIKGKATARLGRIRAPAS